jgi:hypothetical protein
VRAGQLGMALLSLGVGLVSLPVFSAHAEEAPVEVLSDVVLASNQGELVEPPSLGAMKSQFAEAGFVFSSYRRLSSQKLQLAQGREVGIDLPNGRRVALRLQGLKGGTASVQLDIPGAVSTVVKLGREGSVFQHTGAYQGGQLFLVLSAPDGGKPSKGGKP